MDSYFIETKDHKILELKVQNPNNLNDTIVALDGDLAPDGEYEFLKDNTKITVKKGLIEAVH